MNQEHWLGQNGFDKKTTRSLGDAYRSMYGQKPLEEDLIEDQYDVTDEDAIALEEGKKKCKEGYKYDKDKKKCVKKKKSSSNNTTVIVKNRGGGYYGGLHGHGGSNGGGDGDGGDGETESNGGDGGGDGGGGGE